MSDTEPMGSTNPDAGLAAHHISLGSVAACGPTGYPGGVRSEVGLDPRSVALSQIGPSVSQGAGAGGGLPRSYPITRKDEPITRGSLRLERPTSELLSRFTLPP